MSDNMNEIAIEWEKGRNKATISAYGSSKMAGKITRLHNSHPNDVDIHVNKDGSILAHVPTNWVKVSPPKQMSEEQKIAAGERMRKYHENKN